MIQEKMKELTIIVTFGVMTLLGIYTILRIINADSYIIKFTLSWLNIIIAFAILGITMLTIHKLFKVCHKRKEVST